MRNIYGVDEQRAEYGQSKARVRVARGKLGQLSVNDECPEGGPGTADATCMYVCTTRWGVSRDQMTITTAERRLDNDACSASARRREIPVF